VDDFLSIASSKAENDSFKNQMKEAWSISDLGSVRFVMGIAVEWECKERTVMLSQTALIDKLVQMFGQTHAAPTSVPMDPGLKLQRMNRTSLPTTDQNELSKLPYCLLYLAVRTGPDISHAVQQLSQFLDNYSYIHWHAAIRVV
jgi:hypothetical protein